MATIKDIAKTVGVSITTVSRALNGYGDVNEKTRQKIMTAAEQLKYTPNAVARTLVTKKSKTIGLIVSGLSRSSTKDNFAFEVLSGINSATSEYDYDMILFSTDPKKQQQKTYTQLCLERGVDGAILQGIRTDDPYLQEVLESKIPCVLIDIPITDDHVGFVSTDNVQGAKTAVKHLINLGHERIGMVNGHNQAFVSQERLKGYLEAMKEAGLNVDENMILNGKFNEETAYNKALNLLKEKSGLTSFFCASDLMAFGVIKAAKKLGLKVPEDLSVVGYDDIILSSYVSPQLTTISQNKFDMGYRSAELLIQMLSDNKSVNKVVLDTELKVRETTAAPFRSGT